MNTSSDNHWSINISKATIMDKVNYTQSDLADIGHKCYMPNYKPRNIVFVNGKGSVLKDYSGKEYIDLGSGIGVNCLGHQDSEIVEALTSQASKLWHTSNIYFSEPPIQLAQELVEKTFADQVFFCNSGAEANEAAIKLARKFSSETYPPEKRTIISFEGSFHGRTLATVTATAQPKYHAGFEPLPGGFRYCSFNDVAGLQSQFDDDVCAVLVEPIQGEGGVVPIDNEFLTEIRRLCDEHNALLILDEIQCGMGRTGKLLAYEWCDGIKPDIVTLAKALGAGMPIGAMLATGQISESLAYGSHGSTFGGNPISCSVARVVLRRVTDPEFQNAVTEKGRYMRKCLNQINDELNLFSEIRGRGLMIGAVFKEEFSNVASDAIDQCLEEGVLVLQAGPNVLRFLPAMTISTEELSEAFNRIGSALRQIGQSARQ